VQVTTGVSPSRVVCQTVTDGLTTEKREMHSSLKSVLRGKGRGGGGKLLASSLALYRESGKSKGELSRECVCDLDHLVRTVRRNIRGNSYAWDQKRPSVFDDVFPRNINILRKHIYKSLNSTMIFFSISIHILECYTV
jgi:hypothetical protein